MNDLTMGQRIAERRKMLGLSQEGLGEKAGVSRQAISKWESDGAVPEIDKLIALSRLFGVSVGWLLGVEEQSEAKYDGLNETQLKMVEEIVRRYQSSAPPEPDQTIKGFRGTVCLLMLVLAFVAVVSILNPGTDNNQLTSQITQLQREYSAIQNQLSSLSDRLDAISEAADNQEKLLTNYGFEMTQLDESARFTFYGIPKTYLVNQTATLRVSRGTGEVYHEYICQWDGMNWTCDIQLAIENGYEFAFLLKDPGGTQYIQPLDGKYLATLESSIAPTFELNGPIKVERQLGELWVTWVGGQLWMPELVIESEDLYWEEFSCVLYVDGTETDRLSMLPEGNDPHERYQPFSALSTGGSLMETPTLYDGMLVEIKLYARLSNGTSWEFPGGNWIVENGEPVEQNINR